MRRDDFKVAGLTTVTRNQGKEVRVRIVFGEWAKLPDDDPGVKQKMSLGGPFKHDIEAAVKAFLVKKRPAVIANCLKRLTQAQKMTCSSEVKACFMAWYTGAAEGSNLRANVKTWLEACSAWGVSFDVVNVLFVFALLTL